MRDRAAASLAEVISDTRICRGVCGKKERPRERALKMIGGGPDESGLVSEKN